jgi:hypothetical protein
MTTCALQLASILRAITIENLYAPVSRVHQAKFEEESPYQQLSKKEIERSVRPLNVAARGLLMLRPGVFGHAFTPKGTIWRAAELRLPKVARLKAPDQAKLTEQGFLSTIESRTTA